MTQTFPDTAPIALKSRGILALSGPDVKPFLQGLVTNDISKLAPGKAMYAAHLTGQGRFLHDFIITRPDDNTLWLDCVADEVLPLAQALHKYQVHEKVEFDDLRTDMAVYASAEVPKNMPKAATAVDDPRHPALGMRVYVPANTPLESPATEETYTHLRINLGIPDGAVDVLKGKTIAGEFCLDDLNGVSYTKGCYVGQEMTARTHYRTSPKKHIMQVDLAGPAPTPGTPVLKGQREVGHLFSCAGGKGIAILRHGLISPADELHAAEATLRAHKPAWASYNWPTDE